MNLRDKVLALVNEACVVMWEKVNKEGDFQWRLVPWRKHRKMN